MRDDKYNHREDVRNCWYKECCDLYGTDDCTDKCRKFTQTDYMFQLSNMPKSMWKAQNLDTSYLTPDVRNSLDLIKADIEYFVKQGYNLYLYGSFGTGKTSWAVKLMNGYFANVAERSAFTTRGLFISVPSFLRDSKLNMTYKSDEYWELLREVQRCDVVIWDDIGQTDATSYETQWLYSYINERLLAKKSNIFTSNLTPEEFGMVDCRLQSRVCGSSDCLLITGPDMRMCKTYLESINSEEVMNNDSGSDS